MHLFTVLRCLSNRGYSNCNEGVFYCQSILGFQLVFQKYCYFTIFKEIFLIIFISKIDNLELNSAQQNFLQFKGLNERAFNHIIFHLQKANLFEQLQKVICNVYFIHKRYLFSQIANLLSEFIEGNDFI